MTNSTLGRFKSLRFPEDVGTDAVPAYIRFTPQKVKYGGTKGLNPVGRPQGISYNDPNKVAQGPLGVLDQIKTQIGGSIDSFATAAKSAIAAIGNVFKSANFTAATTELGKIINGSVKIGGFEFSLGQKTDPDKLHSLGSINLYLPEGLLTQSGVQYGAKEMGGTGMAALKVAQGLANSNASSAQIMKDSGAVLTNAVADIVAAASPVAQSAFTMATGKVRNNFSFQIFEGVGHRNFDYTFKLVPKNDTEAKAIKDICDTFLFLMLPSRSSSLDVQFYDVPCQWKIEYQMKGNRLQYHQQPNACFLTNVNVTYGSETGNNLYNDGSPMDVQLTLSFVEIEPLYQKDDKKGAEKQNLESQYGGGL